MKLNLFFVIIMAFPFCVKAQSTLTYDANFKVDSIREQKRINIFWKQPCMFNVGDTCNYQLSFFNDSTGLLQLAHRIFDGIKERDSLARVIREKSYEKTIWNFGGKINCLNLNPLPPCH